MILNRPFSKVPPIYLTSDSLSYPPLFSSKLSVLSLSSENERKHLVKRLNTEGQSPELAKGEVVLRKEILSLGKETLTLKSHEDVYVRSDEITLKQQRDLGVFTNAFSGQQHSSSTAQSQDESSSDNQEAAAPSFMDTLPHSLENLTDRQTKLESEMAKLTAKVDAMDSKLDLILSILLSGPGHDAKKGEKRSNPDDPDEDTDDVPESSKGHKAKEATTDAAKATTDTAKSLPEQSTHVAGTSQAIPAEAEDVSTDLLIDSVEEAAKLYQDLEIQGNIHTVHYKDPRLLLVDEVAARKLLESEFPGEDIEQILQEQELYLSQSKPEKSKTGRQRKRRTSNVSRKGVAIPGNKRPNTRAQSKLPSIPEKEKGKKVLEGPSEINQQSDQCAAGILSEQVTTDPNLGYPFGDEDEEEEEVTMLTLRNKKKDADGKEIEAIAPAEKKNSETSGYIVLASQAEKEYISKIKKAGNIFTRDVSEEEMAARRQLHRTDDKTDRGIRRADASQGISKEKLIFHSGGLIQNVNEIQNTNPSTDEKRYEFLWEELVSKHMKSLAPLTTGGLGHSKAQMANVVPLEDCTRLTDKLSEEISQKNLDELISVQLIVDLHDGTDPKVKMLYFLKNGKVCVLSEQDLALKHWKELEHVLYLLNPKDRECKRWAESIQRNIFEKKKVLGLRTEKFSPKYINYAGKETEMKKDGATLQTVLGTTSLMFNPESDKGGCIILGERMTVSKIENLRAAIYQSSESTGEIKKIRNKLIELLMVAEQKLMEEFLASKWGFQTVAELLKQSDDEQIKI